MFHFIKERSSASLRTKLTLIYMLNVLDIIFTMALLKTDCFVEVNQFMAFIVEDSFMTILIKLFLPALLIIYVLLNTQHLSESSLKTVHFFMTLIAIIYFLVLCLHVFYTISYLFMMYFPYSF